MPVVKLSPVADASPAPTKPASCRDKAELPTIVEIGGDAGDEGGTGGDDGGAGA